MTSPVRYNILILFLIAYVLLFTGIASDDYIFINRLNGIYPAERMLSTPILHYSHIILYDLFKLNSVLYDFVKIFWIFISFLMLEKFFSIFVHKHKSILISLIFIFFPIHDSTTYWFLAQYLTLTISFYLFAYYLAHNNKLYMAFVFALMASFVSYGSTPIALGLFLLFLLNKEFKKSYVIILPNIIYMIYYIYLTKVLKIGTVRLNDTDLIQIVKQYILQVGTFLDSSIGPSFWLKLFYSITQLTFLSIFIGVSLTILFYKFYQPKKETISKLLLISLIIMLLLAFGIFALTGYYPQIAFNLGNRVTIFGSLLVSYLVVLLLMNNKNIATIIFSLFIFTTLGLSDHWKAWNKTQLKIIDNISKNNDLKEFDRSNQLFVSYNQFSKLGDISHIEFFAEGISSTIFKLSTKESYKVSPLNRRFYLKDSNIIDKKYGTKINIEKVIYVYDSHTDKLLEIKKENIQEYINSLPKDNRHWVQLLSKDNFIMKIVLKLMPRLEYAL